MTPEPEAVTALRIQSSGNARDITVYIDEVCAELERLRTVAEAAKTYIGAHDMLAYKTAWSLEMLNMRNAAHGALEDAVHALRQAHP